MAMNLNLNSNTESRSNFDVEIREKKPAFNDSTKNSGKNVASKPEPKKPDKKSDKKSNKNSGGNNKLIIILIGAAVVVFAIMAALVLFSGSGDDGQSTENTDQAVVATSGQNTQDTQNVQTAQAAETPDQTTSQNDATKADTSTSATDGTDSGQETEKNKKDPNKITYNPDIKVTARSNQASAMAMDMATGTDTNMNMNMNTQVGNNSVSGNSVTNNNGQQVQIVSNVMANISYSVGDNMSVAFLVETDMATGMECLFKITDNDGYSDVGRASVDKSKHIKTKNFDGKDGNGLSGHYVVYMCDTDYNLLKSWNVTFDLEKGVGDFKDGLNASDVTYVMNENTKMYHKIGCEVAKNIKIDGIGFTSNNEEYLKDLEYIPCDKCMQAAQTAQVTE